jgi:hypothetical protein
VGRPEEAMHQEGRRLQIVHFLPLRLDTAAMSHSASITFVFYKGALTAVPVAATLQN